MLTFPKTSIVTKLSLPAHPSKGPQFFAFQPESLDGPWLSKVKKKKKRSLDPKGEGRKMQHCKLALKTSNS